MAKRATSSKKSASASSEVAAVTPVRKTVTPRKSTKSVATPDVAATVAAPVLTQDKIAERAYFISLSGTGGSESENWFRAESELKREMGI
jgi:hypothetical protein